MWVPLKADPRQGLEQSSCLGGEEAPVGEQEREGAGKQPTRPIKGEHPVALTVGEWNFPAGETGTSRETYS